MITDSHAHLFHPDWYPKEFIQALIDDFIIKRGKRGNVSTEAMSGKMINMLSDNSGDLTIKIMDKVDIDRKVILIVDWGIELSEPSKSIWQIHKEILSICSKFPDRLFGFAGVDPRRPDAAEILEWAFDSMDAKGLKLHPTGKWKLADEKTIELVGLAASRHLPVMVHVGKTLNILSDNNSHPSFLIELASNFPNCIFIAGHSGFDLCSYFLETAPIPENIYFDISGWQELENSDGFIDKFLFALANAFPNRIFFGTDSPFYSYNLAISEKSWLNRIRKFIDQQPECFRSNLENIFSFIQI